MKTPASSAAAKRHARHTKKLQQQAKHAQRVEQSQQVQSLDELTPVHRRAAGIDIGSTENYVAIPNEGLAEGEAAVRVFGVFSAEQDALVEWLRAHQITTVAMEATGIYWLSLFDKLEAAGLEVYLVDAHAVKAVPGRKSDCLDLIQCGAAHQERMEKALIPMNVQLNLAVSDIIGETGLRIIEAILKGQRDPKELVKLRDPRCHKTTVAEMEAALTGTYNDEDLFVLRQSLEGWKFYQRQMRRCDQKIEQVLAVIPKSKPATQLPPRKSLPAAAQATPKRKRTDTGHNAPSIDFSESLRTICGVDLMKVCGLNVLSVLMLIAEIGTDMAPWRNARAFCSWLGLCPGTKKSGGKVLSRRTRHVKNRASTILRLAAWAAGKTDTWIGRFYRRGKARRGAPKAVTATARKLACVIYHRLKYREEFQLLDMSAYEVQAREHRLCRLKKEAKIMGFDLVELQRVA